MEHLNRLFDIHPWKLKTTQLHKDMRLQESLTSIGNGYMGMRGNFEEWRPSSRHVSGWRLVPRQNKSRLVEERLS